MKEQEIRGALQIAEGAYAALRNAAQVGATETELLCAVREACGTHEIKFDLLTGERTAQIEGGATERALRLGDAVLLDLSVKNGDHWCDVCRTYALGSADERFAAVYTVVEECYRRTAALLRPGVKAAALYGSVEAFFRDRGMQGYLRHHTGHGIGRLPFEPPIETAESNDVLHEGDIMTVEIGAYATDAFGVRLEDDYLLTKDGSLCLWSEPHGLTVLPASH